MDDRTICQGTLTLETNTPWVFQANMGLLAPFFMLGLFGLLLPWVLHHLSQQNAPVKDFPSGQFLEQTSSISSREKHLKYLKLLALRVLMLLTLCLLFAEPVINRMSASAADSTALHLIVIDQSFSMQHGTRWTEAVRKVGSVLSSIPDSMAVQLMGVESSLNVITQPATDKSIVDTALSSLEPGYGAFSYNAVMRWLDTYAEKQTLPVSVYLITDSQATAMPLRLSELQAQHLNSLEVFQVGQTSSFNRSIRAFVEPQNEEFFDIQTEISVFGEKAGFEDVQIRLEKEGALVAEKSVKLDDKGQGRFKFESLEWPAATRLANYRITIDKSDALPEDDYALLPVRAMPFSQVRIADHDFAGRTESRVEVIYMKTAVGLDKRNKVVTSRLTSSGISEDTDVLLYIDDTAPASEELPKLPAVVEKYLSGGGNVLYVLNADGSEKASDISVSDVDASHPINLELDQWSDVEFYSQRKLALSDGDKSLITTSGGYPVLIESTRAQGRLLWLNASLNGANNNLPVSPVFVPFMHGLINYFLRSDAYPSHLSVGQSVKLGKRVQIIGPNGTQIRDLADTADTANELLDRRGVYTILDKRGEHSLVVSVDPQESDTRVADSNVVRNWQFASAEGAVTGNQGSSVSTSNVSGRDNPGRNKSNRNKSNRDQEHGTISLFKWLLPLAGLLLLLESLYANHHLRVRRSA